MNEMNLAMPCAEYEHDLVELLDGALTPEHARVVRLHVASCPRCRAWQQEFAALDARLAGTLPRPELSPGFDRRLTERLAGLTRRASSADLKAAADRDYARAIDAIRRGAGRHAVLDALGSAAVAGGLAVLVDRWLAPLGGVLSALDGPARLITLGVLGSAVALVALGWSARRGALPLPASFR
jgi:anti-sigma factor RsiW